MKNDGVVTFEQVGDGQTRINVQMDVESESSTQNVAGDLLGIVKNQVHGDLERFKTLIEDRDEETGAWRGEVAKGEARYAARGAAAELESVREPLDSVCEEDGSDEDDGKASRKEQAGHR